jgi:hypothetical protein
MDVPVLNKGEHLYDAKLNVTVKEHEWILKHRWHKLRGQPWNNHLGYLFDIVSSWRKNDDETFFFDDDTLLPIHKNSKCVAYSHVDPVHHKDLSRHMWNINKEGYAYFFNQVTKQNVYLHRYVTNFPENDLVVDHVYWNRLDNRLSFLRICSRSENSKNISHRRFSSSL